MDITKERHGIRFTSKTLVNEQVKAAAYEYDPSSDVRYASVTVSLDRTRDEKLRIRFTEDELITMLNAVRKY